MVCPLDKSILSDINITVSALFWLVLALCIFSILFKKIYFPLYFNRIFFSAFYAVRQSLSLNCEYWYHLHLMLSICLGLKLPSCYLFSIFSIYFLLFPPPLFLLCFGLILSFYFTSFSGLSASYNSVIYSSDCFRFIVYIFNLTDFYL